MPSISTQRLTQLIQTDSGGVTYDATLSISRVETVSDQMTNNISPLILLSETDGFSGGMNNSIPKDSSLNKVLAIFELASTEIFPTLTLFQILSQATSTFANMQGSVGLSGDFGIQGDPQQNINPNAALLNSLGIGETSQLDSRPSLSMLSAMGFNVSGGLALLSSLSMTEKMGLSILGSAGIYPLLTLLQILAATPAANANMQGSVGLSGLLGIGGNSQQDFNFNASLTNSLGLGVSGGLSLLSDLSLAERLGFSVLGNASMYTSLILGRDLAFVPANIALIGGNVSLGQALGLIDVPNLNAQTALSFLTSLGISLTSALSTNQVEAVLDLARKLGLSTSVQLNSYPLVGIDKRLFLLDANNANMFGSNVLSEIKTINTLGGLSINGSVAVPIDLSILVSKLVSVFKDVAVQDRLGISQDTLANLQAAVSLGETAGMANAVNQLMNAGLTISVVGSVLTIGGLNVIISMGIVVASDSARNSLPTSNSSSSASVADSPKGSIGISDS